MLLMPQDAAEGYIAVGAVSFAELHPDTEPEAIAQAQRDAVFAAHRNATPEKIGDRVDLPVWTVRRRLAELGLAPPVENAMAKVFAERSKKHRSKKRIIALLRGHPGRSMSCHEIARRLSIDPEYVAKIMVTADEFQASGHSRRRARGGAAQLWALKKEHQ